MFRTVGALLILGLSFTTGAQGQPNTFALACKGTITATSIPEAKPEPASMGIIVNRTSGTVQGFGAPGLLDFPVKITAANDVTIVFSGQQEIWSRVSSVMGSIDRVTGDVAAQSLLVDPKTGSIISQTDFMLQCRPAQRMF